MYTIRIEIERCQIGIVQTVGHVGVRSSTKGHEHTPYQFPQSAANAQVGFNVMY